MTRPQFMKIAKATTEFFWPLVYQNVSQEEATYLRKTPVARRNLDRRLFMALAHTLLSPDQLQAVANLDLEDPQTSLDSGPTTRTPLATNLDQHTATPREDPEP